MPPHVSADAADRGRVNYHAGLSAEAAVQRYYCAQGAELRETRWRGRGGEIDLIFNLGELVVFVEVKKSRTHAQAAQHLSARQMQRLMTSAEDYLGTCPDGSLTNARLDVALVDQSGMIEIIPNATMSF